MDGAKKRKFSLGENNEMDLDCIKEAIKIGDIQLINEFISDKDIVNRFVNGDPHEFYEILSSAINIDRNRLALSVNVNETYDDLILQFIKVAKEKHFGSFDGKTLLMSALLKRMSYKIIDELLKAGSDINAASNDTNMTPIMYALRTGYDRDTISELINRGADINSRDYLGGTPLFDGMEFHCSDRDIIEVLLKAGSNVHAVDGEGRNVLMIDNCQCCEGDECITKGSIDLLLRYGINEIDFKRIDNDGNNVIHETYCKYVLELALKSGVSIEAKNNDGQTPLLKDVSSEKSCLDGKCVYLLELGADVNSTDEDLQTALHLSVVTVDEYLNDSMIITLIYYGADMYARTINNQTPLDLVVQNSEFHLEEVIFLIPMHIILFEDSGFEFGEEVWETLHERELDVSYFSKCKKELAVMQETFIADGLTFYEFCILKRYYKSKCVNISLSEYKYSCSEIRELFPIYKGVIIIRVKDNRLKKHKMDLCKKLEQITVSAIPAVKTDFREVLNYDCFYRICKYLNYKEMFNIFCAAIES